MNGAIIEISIRGDGQAANAAAIKRGIVLSDAFYRVNANITYAEVSVDYGPRIAAWYAENANEPREVSQEGELLAFSAQR